MTPSHSPMDRPLLSKPTPCSVPDAALVALFATTFTASEGAAEGALIGGLVQDLLDRTPPEALHRFCTCDGADVIAAVLFTPLTYAGDPRRVVLLSPMAVAPAHQRRGLGQALLTRALATLRAEGIDVAITYGDPAFYGKVGFQPITEDQARAPLPLSMPQGWLGQSLSGTGMPDLSGAATCVPALHRADIW